MTWWWKTPHNVEVFRKAHVFRPGDYASVQGYVIQAHPDVWCGADGQFNVSMWRTALVVDVVRQGDPDEFVKIVVIDNKGKVRSGYVGRWTPQSGNCNVSENIKYLYEDENALAAEQRTDHQVGGRSGRGDQGQDPTDSRDPEQKRLRSHLERDQAAFREELQRVRRR